MNAVATRLLTSAVLFPALLSPPSPKENLRFSIQEGQNQNWFFENKNAAVQLVVTSGKPRIIAAFPAGNSGIGLWFEGQANLKLLNPAAKSSHGGQEVQFSIVSDQSELILSDTKLDNIRLLRDAPMEKEARAVRQAYAQKNGISSEGFAFPNERVEKTTGYAKLIFERKDFGIKESYQAALTFPPGTILEKTSQGWKISNPFGKISFQARFSVPYRALTPLSPDQIISPKAMQTLRQKDNSPVMRQALMNLEFLACKEKFLAGGWQYLTYFGRDTALTLLMLGDMLTSDAYEAGMQSMLDRVSDEGKVAHEEDIGSLSQVERIRQGLPPGSGDKPVLHYAMKDEDFLLPIVVVFARYLKKVPHEKARIFLEKKNIRGETNRETLLRCFNPILSKAAAFSQSGRYQDLIHLDPGEKTGNWRDSGGGLAFGRYPADINLWLVPAALDSIKQISYEFPDKLPRPREIDALVNGWEKAKKLFEISLSPEQIRSKVKNYLDKGPFTSEERSYFLARKIDNQTTISDFLNGKTPDILKYGLTFPALSLDEKGSPIPVLHSDPVLDLFLNPLSKEKLEKILPIFSLPFPLGLSTEAGLLISNPAYTTNPKYWQMLNSDAYHGTVIWVWPQSMLRLGLASLEKQMTRTPMLVAEMQKLGKELQDADKKIGPLALSELYTWQIKNGKMEAIPYGLRAKSETEANAIQLWSSVLPAVVLAEAKNK